MKNHVTVTVRDAKGVKEYTVHKRVRQALWLTVAAGTVLMGIALVSLYELRGEVQQLENARALAQEQKARLEAQSKALQDAIARQQGELSDARVQMDAIELAMGLEAERRATLNFRVQRATDSTTERAQVLERIPSGSPVPYKGINCGFGYRIHPITQKKELHRGLDLKAKMDTPVYATADGVVEFADGHDTKGYGRLIILDHAYGFRTLYGHLHTMAVKEGQVVKKGELIGYSGNSGLSNGPHLHYEVRFVQRSLNPLWFVKWSMGNYDEIFAKVKKVDWQPILEAIAEDTSRLKAVASRAAL